MNYSPSKHSAGLLFFNRGFIYFLFLLCLNLHAQDSINTTSLHVEGGAIVYSPDSDFATDTHENLSADYQRLKNEVDNHGKKMLQLNLFPKSLNRQNVKRSRSIRRSKKA